MSGIIRALARKKILNNILINNLLIALSLDRKYSDYLHYYNNFTPDKSKSLQEIAGYSIHPEINEVLQQLHDRLTEIRKKKLSHGDSILDIGCGPGLFLKDAAADFKTTGLDITPGMIEIVKDVSPSTQTILGNFLDAKIDRQFHLIQSIGMLIYINRGSLDQFFNKIYDHLEENGLFFLSYPHALSRKDTYYPTIDYILYSPVLIEKIASKKFTVIVHEHLTDKRAVGKFDKLNHLHPINPDSRYYKNSSVIILQKKV